MPLSLKTVAVTVDRHEIWEMKKFAEEELGVPFKFDAMMNARIDCSQSPLAVRLTPEEVVGLDFADPGRIAEWNRFSSMIKPQHLAGHEQELYTCGGGINSFAADPEGRMTMGALSRRDTFDLRRGTVLEGWEHFLRRVRERRITRVTKCTACQMKSVCGMCPANGEREAADPESPGDFLCHTSRLRAETFGWKVAPHGACEYCPGGERHDLIVAQGVRLRQQLAGGPAMSKPIPMVMLPSLGAASGGTSSTVPSGCSACSGDRGITG